KVTLGPSTRRIIDFADPTRSLGITPTGNSGVVLDPHYSDQAQTYLKRKYRDQIMDIGAIKADHDPLRLVP
ncbi:MAG: penicillin acylase family protein, partial [Leptospiraceae bacterium]|nr:penicillin acylase family protein [Leptospiraceae bacterium]